MAFVLPYEFKDTNCEVVIQHSHKEYIRTIPTSKPQPIDGRGGTGRWAQWRVHLERGGTHCRLQSSLTGKYIRIWRKGRQGRELIDAAGGIDSTSIFKIHYHSQPHGVRLESDCFPGSFIAISYSRDVKIISGGSDCNLWFLQERANNYNAYATAPDAMYASAPPQQEGYAEPQLGGYAAAQNYAQTTAAQQVPAPHQIPLQVQQQQTVPMPQQQLAVNPEWTQQHYYGEQDQSTMKPFVDNEIGCCAGWKDSKHCKSMLLTLCTLGFVVAAVVIFLIDSYNDSHENESFVYIMAIVAAICYVGVLIECCMSSSIRYLSNIRDKDTVNELITLARNSPPVITWHIQCYHYETRVYYETHTDSDGNEYTERREEEERVDTHSASQEFVYKSWDDVSEDWDYNVRHQITKIHCDKTYCFANYESERIFNDQRTMFTIANNRDTHMDFWTTLKFEGYKKKMMAELYPGGSPCCLNPVCFGVCSMILCSFCYRVWFSSISGRKRYLFVKQVSCF